MSVILYLYISMYKLYNVFRFIFNMYIIYLYILYFVYFCNDKKLSVFDNLFIVSRGE